MSVKCIHADILSCVNFTFQVVGGRERPFILGTHPIFVPTQTFGFTHPKNWGKFACLKQSIFLERPSHAKHFWKAPETLD
jgi:hypothetical protein